MRWPFISIRLVKFENDTVSGWEEVGKQTRDTAGGMVVVGRLIQEVGMS